MKKLLLIATTACLFVSACGAFHSKQPIDDNYYKKTQSVGWPDGNSQGSVSGSSYNGSSGGSYNGSSGGSSTIPVGSSRGNDIQWEDAAVSSAPKMAVPTDPGLKLQCAKQKNGTYTCRKGQYVCGWGCKSDGSKCNDGYCLQSDCDDVMGQKWNLFRIDDRFACKHPDYDVACTPDDSSGIACIRTNGETIVSLRGMSRMCGYHCNANGTQCQDGDNNCWDKYR